MLNQDEERILGGVLDSLDTSADENPCWGGRLQCDSLSCEAGFKLGRGHFKNKVCSNCRRDGIYVPMDRVRVLPKALHEDFSNTSEGLWSAPPAGYSQLPHFRLVNQTVKCTGPRLLLFQKAPPPDNGRIQWGKWPIAWGGGDLVHFIISKGTLLPLPGPRRPPPAVAAAVEEAEDTHESSKSPSKRARSVAPAEVSIDITSLASSTKNPFDNGTGLGFTPRPPSPVPTTTASHNPMEEDVLRSYGAWGSSAGQAGIEPFEYNSNDEEDEEENTLRERLSETNLASWAAAHHQHHQASTHAFSSSHSASISPQNTMATSLTPPPPDTAHLIQLASMHAALATQIETFLNTSNAVGGAEPTLTTTSTTTNDQGHGVSTAAIATYHAALQRVVEPILSAHEALHAALPPPGTEGAPPPLLPNDPNAGPPQFPSYPPSAPSSWRPSTIGGGSGPPSWTKDDNALLMRKPNAAAVAKPHAVFGRDCKRALPLWCCIAAIWLGALLACGLALWLYSEGVWERIYSKWVL